jgi:hypothetical protein
MNPYVMHQLARQRRQDLRRAARHYGLARQPPPGDRGKNDSPRRQTHAGQAHDSRRIAAGSVPLSVGKL